MHIHLVFPFSQLIFLNVLIKVYLFSVAVNFLTYSLNDFQVKCKFGTWEEKMTLLLLHLGWDQIHTMNQSPR